MVIATPTGALSEQFVVGLVFTPHCLERYSERVRVGCERLLAERDLRRVVRGGGRWCTEPPLWVSWHRDAVGYVVIGDDVVLPIRVHAVDGTPLATTCLTRGWMPGPVRASRRAAKRRRHDRWG